MKHFKFKKGILACLLSLALAFSCFSTVGIKAEEAAATSTATATAPSEVAATYKWAENTIESTANATAYVYVLKAEKGNTIKAGTAANGQMASNKISLADLKVTKINKDAYFYVCDKEFETEGKSINANLVIKATSVKKAAGAIDYTQADDPDSVKVLSATATDTAGKKIENPTVYWSTEANGTYYAVNDTAKTAKRKYADGNTDAPNGFDGRTLKEMLEAGGVVYIKIAGVDGGTGSAQFASKAIKVKVAKEAKAPKVKVDVKKDTFSIKNGMDFGLFTKTKVDGNDSYTLVGGWKTVLPQLKDAATKELAASIVATSDYKPVDKKDDAAKKSADETTHKVSYTSLKVKNLGYKTLISSLSAEDTDTTEYYIGVRTSATSKKPASAVTYFKYAEKTEAPIVYTESCVSGQYLVASGTDFDKKGIALKSVVNYNGVNGTEGYDDGFKLTATAGSGADTAAANYEFAIVNKADLEIIDWSTVGWKKLDVAKTKITSKLKTGYSTVSGTTVKKVKAQLSAIAKPDDFDPADGVPSTAKTVILVRRTGVKGKTADDSVVASNIIELYVIKDGKNYSIYSTEDVGDVAYKYTVKFTKYLASTSGQTTTYGWDVASDVDEISVWVKPGDKKYVALPTVEGAELFKTSTSGSGYATSESGVETVASGDNKGKYEVTIASSESGDKTEYIAIREYANVKVVSVASDSGETVGTGSTVGTVKAGKIGSATTVSAYVGTEFKVSLSGEATVIPTGYTSKSGASVAISSESGEGYTGGSYNSTSGELTLTVNTADEVTVTVKNPVVKVYTIKYDLNKSFVTDLASENTAPADATTNGAKKLDSLAETTSFEGKVVTSSDTPTTTWYKVEGWYKEKECTNKVDSSTEYSANTTLYAKWVVNDSHT